jgi:hypothetical protein
MFTTYKNNRDACGKLLRIPLSAIALGMFKQIKHIGWHCRIRRPISRQTQPCLRDCVFSQPIEGDHDMKKSIPDLAHLLIITAVLVCLAIGSSVSVGAESSTNAQQQLEAALTGQWRMKEKLPTTTATIAGTDLCNMAFIKP